MKTGVSMVPWAVCRRPTRARVCEHSATTSKEICGKFDCSCRTRRRRPYYICHPSALTIPTTCESHSKAFCIRRTKHMPVAELENVTKNYGPIAALRGIDLTIGRGELVALLGPNGAGKTTAVRILLGLTDPSKGQARILGHHPSSREAKLRRGALLQVARVPETLRVREHVELFSSYYDHPLPVAETIAAAGLQGLERRLFGDLSGGQKQRVLFALAICGNPDLLFLDEPTVGLDVEARRTLWQHIRGFVARGGSVLLTT